MPRPKDLLNRPGLNIHVGFGQSVFLNLATNFDECLRGRMPGK
jgi:hypothetical protein